MKIIFKKKLLGFIVFCFLSGFSIKLFAAAKDKNEVKAEREQEALEACNLNIRCYGPDFYLTLAGIRKYQEVLFTLQLANLGDRNSIGLFFLPTSLKELDDIYKHLLFNGNLHPDKINLITKTDTFKRTSKSIAEKIYQEQNEITSKEATEELVKKLFLQEYLSQAEEKTKKLNEAKDALTKFFIESPYRASDVLKRTLFVETNKTVETFMFILNKNIEIFQLIFLQTFVQLAAQHLAAKVYEKLKSNQIRAQEEVEKNLDHLTQTKDLVGLSIRSAQSIKDPTIRTQLLKQTEELEQLHTVEMIEWLKLRARLKGN